MNMQASLKHLKSSWTASEDLKLQEFIQEYGPRNWTLVSQMIKTKTGKQCRERWHNHLDPFINKNDWSTEEDQLIIELQSRFGNQWAKITKRLPGRTDNSVKNRFHLIKRSWNRLQRVQAKEERKTNQKKSTISCTNTFDISTRTPSPDFIDRCFNENETEAYTSGTEDDCLSFASGCNKRNIVKNINGSSHIPAYFNSHNNLSSSLNNNDLDQLLSVVNFELELMQHTELKKQDTDRNILQKVKRKRL